MYLISIKNLKHSEFASHETNCFEATVYVNGKRAFLASDQGNGGGNMYTPLSNGEYQETRELVNKINAELSMQHLPECDISNDLDIVIGELINDKLVEKDVKRMLKRVSYFDGADLRQLPVKYKPSPDLCENVKKSSWWKDSYIMLNEMSIKDVTEIYRTIA